MRQGRLISEGSSYATLKEPTCCMDAIRRWRPSVRFWEADSRFCDDLCSVYRVEKELDTSELGG